MTRFLARMAVLAAFLTVLAVPGARAGLLDGVHKLYVVDFKGDIPKGWGQTMASMVSARLLDALRSRKVEVFTWLNLKQQLNVEQKKEILRCNRDQGCVEEIISGFGIAVKLFGHITKLAKDKYSISLTLMKRARPLNKLARVVNTTQDGLLKVVPGLALQVVGVGVSHGPQMSAGVVDETAPQPATSNTSPPPMPVMVRFQSVPSGAVVLVDGQVICQDTPCSRNINKGPHKIELQKERYEPARKTIDIQSNRSLSMKLIPKFGVLHVTSTPTGLPVTVNGKPKGNTPLDMELTAGEAFRISHSSPCYYSQTKRVVMTRGQHLTLNLIPKPKTGWVQVVASDRKGNALKGTAFVDGSRVGVVPGNFRVSVCAKEFRVKTGKGEYKTRLKVDVSRPFQVKAVIRYADCKSPKVCYELGLMYDNGKGVEKNDKQACKYYKKACDMGNADGCFSLGLMYHYGEGVEKDKNRAIRNYKLGVRLSKRACNKGDAKACYRLGRMGYYIGLGVEEDVKHAVRLYRKSCNMGYAKACYDLGQLYDNGKVGNKDYKSACKYYKKACDMGHAKGCYDLGRMYRNGRGVKNDAKQACRYYKKACDMGYAEGCRSVGGMYIRGYGVEKDSKSAFKYIKKACNMGGKTKACWELGLMYDNGMGVEKDSKQAHKYYDKACNMGDTTEEIGSCFNYIGHMYEHGESVEKDSKQACIYYKKACDMKVVKGCKHYRKHCR